MREQFTFYRSFADALKRIKKDADRAKAYDAICDYALYEIEPDLDALPDAAALAFQLIKPNLDASKRKSDNGKAGGRPKTSEKQNESKTKANAKQEQTGNKKENKKEKENECYIPPIPPFADKPVLQSAFDRWLKYKAERKEAYKPQGLQALITQVQKHAGQYGEAAIANLIDECMAAQWKGIIWEKLEKRNGSSDEKKAEWMAKRMPTGKRDNSWMKDFN